MKKYEKPAVCFDKFVVLKYKRSPDFVLREISGEYVLIPTGDAAKKLYGIISLTESGKLLWELLAEEKTVQELVEALSNVYEVEKKTARTDVHRFLEKLRKEELLIEAD